MDARAASVSAIDNRVNGTYFVTMLTRAIAMLAVLMIAAVTTLAPAHAARMGTMPEQAAHVAGMVQDTQGANASCDSKQHCDSAAAGVCEFACAGISILLPSPGDEVARGFLSVHRHLPSAERLASRAPGLNERPPRTRLL